MLTEHYVQLYADINIIIITFFRLSWIQVDGTIYKTGGAIILETGLVPTFGKIVDLVVLHESYYLVCEVMFTDCFNHHFHSYEISTLQPINYVLCKPSDLPDHNVLGIYNISNSHFISLKYHIIEKL